MEIELESYKSFALVNPRMPDADLIKARLEGLGLRDHFYISSSGSTGQKWVALSKKALFASAAVVNDNLKISSDDIWAHPLPDFHVGGLSVWARSLLAGARVADFKVSHAWNPDLFLNYLQKESATVTSLVPAMLYDLVSKFLRAPDTLRVVLIGGGRLDKILKKRAEDLGWRCIETYGLTECSSQVATSSEGVDELYILPHVRVRIEDSGRIALQSASLLTGYVHLDEQQELKDPKVNGWFITEDLGSLEGNQLIMNGRQGDMVKVGGEGVNMSHLEEILMGLKFEIDVKEDLALLAVEDERLENSIVLAVTSTSLRLLVLVEEFQKRVMPFSRIRRVIKVPHIPRTSLGKLMKEELVRLISEDKGSYTPEQWFQSNLVKA